VRLAHILIQGTGGGERGNQGKGPVKEKNSHRRPFRTRPCRMMTQGRKAHTIASNTVVGIKGEPTRNLTEQRPPRWKGKRRGKNTRFKKRKSRTKGIKAGGNPPREWSPSLGRPRRWGSKTQRRGKEKKGKPYWERNKVRGDHVLGKGTEKVRTGGTRVSRASRERYARHGALLKNNRARHWERSGSITGILQYESEAIVMGESAGELKNSSVGRGYIGEKHRRS